MNGRVYDPLLARFGTPDPTTENPFSTQGWNRYTYVGNSPTNFTDPSGYCFLGCFWKGIFKAFAAFLRVPMIGTLLQIVAGAVCGPPCAALAPAATAAAGITSGNLVVAIKAGFISIVTSLIGQSIFEAMSSYSGQAPSGAGSSDWGSPMGMASDRLAPPGS